MEITYAFGRKKSAYNRCITAALVDLSNKITGCYNIGHIDKKIEQAQANNNTLLRNEVLVFRPRYADWEVSTTDYKVYKLVNIPITRVAYFENFKIEEHFILPLVEGEQNTAIENVAINSIRKILKLEDRQNCAITVAVTTMIVCAFCASVGAWIVFLCLLLLLSVAVIDIVRVQCKINEQQLLQGAIQASQRCERNKGGRA